MRLLQAAWLGADAVSLLLTAPAALAGLLCSCRSGGSGVGRHSQLDGCRVAVTAGATVEVTITASEVALLMAFCVLQAVRLMKAMKLRGRFAISLLLNMLATALLLTAAAVLSANNPHSLLYSGPFALLMPALMSKMAGLSLSVVAEMRALDEEAEQLDEPPPPSPRPVDEKTLGLDEELPFADQDSLVYDLLDDGTLEWRIGSDQGAAPATWSRTRDLPLQTAGLATKIDRLC